jgi:hypothetical protein
MYSIESASSTQTSKPFLRRSKPMTGLVRTIAIITLAALAAAAAGLPSYAAQPGVAPQGTRAFDGTWSVVMQTTRGNCPAAVRASVRILGGRLLAEDQSYGIDGRVAPSGAVRVTVSAAGQGAGGFGHLSRNTGQGLWRTLSGECSGQWAAARRE